MNTIVKTDKIIENALINEVTSENLVKIFDTEEIIQIKQLLNSSKHIFLESFLLSHAEEIRISAEYKTLLSTKAQEEENLISQAVYILQEAAEITPREIQDFFALYALESLHSDFGIISKKISNLLNNPKNVQFLEELENKLGLKDPAIGLDLLRAIKLRYADREDSYYINLLIWYTKYISFGMLYIFVET